MIYIQVRIKSRAFGVTFGTFDKTFEWSPFAGSPIKFPKASDVLFDARGVFVRVWT